MTFTTRRLTLRQLAHHIQAGHAWTGEHRKQRHHRPTRSRPDYQTTYRVKANYSRLSLLVLDVETHDERSRLDYWLDVDPFASAFASLVHTTASHTDAAPRCRVVFQLDRPVSVATYELLAQAAFHRWPFVDTGAGDASRIFYGARGCDLVLRPERVLDGETAERELLRPYLAHLDQQTAERERQREQRRSAAAHVNNANAGCVAGYVDATLRRVVSEATSAPAGQRHSTLRAASLRLASIAVADWLDEDAQRIAATWRDELTDAAHVNGYIDDYGDADLERLLDGAVDRALPADRPVLAADSAQRFFVGDSVVLRPSGELATVERVKTAKNGAWLHYAAGAWYPRELLTPGRAAAAVGVGR